MLLALLQDEVAQSRSTHWTFCVQSLGVSGIGACSVGEQQKSAGSLTSVPVERLVLRQPPRRPRPQMEATSLLFSGVGQAFSTIFVSEIGDKTFFLSMILAVRRGRFISLLSSLTALWLMVFISVGIGSVLKSLPTKMGDVVLVRAAAAVLMIAFGVQSLRERSEENCEEKDEAECEIDEKLESRKGRKGKRGFFLDWFEFSVLIFLAEWGDRSMLATVALAASKSPVGVLCGGCLGHAAAATLAVGAGGFIGKYVSDRAMKTIGGGLFIAFGVTTLFGIY